MESWDAIRSRGLGQATCALALAVADLGIGSCHSSSATRPRHSGSWACRTGTGRPICCALGIRPLKPIQKPIQKPIRRPSDAVEHHGGR